MASKGNQTSEKNCVWFEAASKMKNCVLTALARADRGSDPPEKLKQTVETPSTKQHTYKPNIPSKNISKDNPKINENPIA